MWSSPLLLLLPRCCLVKLLLPVVLVVLVFWLSSTRQTTERQTKPNPKTRQRHSYAMVKIYFRNTGTLN